MNFYNEPNFWVFMTTFWGGVFGSIKLHYFWKDRSNKKNADLNMSVERFKSDYINKSIDFLNDSISEIKPIVARHEVLMKDLENSTKMVSIIEHEMKKMIADLSHQYEGFNTKIVNVTVSFQKVLDKVNDLDKEIKMKLGTVTRKP